MDIFPPDFIQDCARIEFDEVHDDGIRYYLYDFFCKVYREKRLDTLTYEEAQKELKEKYPNKNFSKKMFDEYKKTWSGK